MQVLIVEDDSAIRRLVRDGLERQGVDVTEAGTVKDAMDALRGHALDLVILDLTLPDGSGIEILEHLKQTDPDAHVIVLSGAATERDRVRTLELGADDYVVKPFFARELTARILAVRRRRSAEQSNLLRIGHLEIDLAARRVLADGVVVDLTLKEFALLAYLAARPGHVFSRNDILRAVWQSAPDWQTPTTVTEHIRRLRKKIEVDPQRPRLLRTVRGAGYRFDPPIDDSQTLLRQRVADVLGIVVTLEGRVVFADAAAAVLLGVAHEADLLGTEVLDIVAPRSLLAARERMRLTASGGAPRSQVLLVTHQNSTEVPVEVTTTTVEWQGQEAVRIELRHAAVESLRRRHLVTGVLSEVTDAVVVTDMHFHISSWNEAAERLYGWTEDEVLGRHLLDIVEWAGGDELVSAALARLEATGQWHGEGCQHTRDGFEIAVRASTSIVRDDDGLSIGIVSVNRQIDLDHISSPRVPDAEDIADLRRALEQHELTVYYQPVVSLDDQRTITVEALVRWNHPTRGLLDPEAFIETAERSGLILELGSFVLGEACRQVAAWRLEGSDIALAVNLSAMELADRSIVRRITATVAAAGLDLTALWLEVTESALVADVEQASVLLHRLAALGVGIAIDDFGTGWASLTYLRQFPVHVLKIDRSFVSGVDHDSNNAAIVRSILSLGAELGLAVVAEGIETRAEERALQELGCSIGQGFRYGRPTPSHEVDLDRMHRMATRGAGSTDATTGALPINGYPVPRSIDGLREGWEAVFERATSRAAVADGALRIEFGHDMPLVELVQLVEDEQHRTATLSFAITVDHRGVGLELRAPHGAEQVIASLLGSSGDQAGLPAS